MEPRLNLLTLGVRDLDRAIRFYRDGLGWPMSSAGDDGVAFFRAGGVVLSLFPRDDLAADANLSPDGSGFGGITLAHNVREREEVGRVVALALTAGATLIRPPSEAFWGGYTAYVADPDGHPWEIAWNPFFPLDEAGLVILPE